MKKLICVALVLCAAGCIHATDTAKQLSRENVMLAETADKNAYESCKKFTVLAARKARELDTELAKEGVDIAAGVEQAANVVAEVAPVVASLPFPWAPVVGVGLLTATALALAIAHGLKKKTSA